MEPCSSPIPPSPARSPTRVRRRRRRRLAGAGGGAGGLASATPRRTPRRWRRSSAPACWCRSSRSSARSRSTTPGSPTTSPATWRRSWCTAPTAGWRCWPSPAPPAGRLGPAGPPGAGHDAGRRPVGPPGRRRGAGRRPGGTGPVRRRGRGPAGPGRGLDAGPGAPGQPPGFGRTRNLRLASSVDRSVPTRPFAGEPEQISQAESAASSPTRIDRPRTAQNLGSSSTGRRVRSRRLGVRRGRVPRREPHGLRWHSHWRGGRRDWLPLVQAEAFVDFGPLTGLVPTRDFRSHGHQEDTSAPSCASTTGSGFPRSDSLDPTGRPSASCRRTRP